MPTILEIIREYSGRPEEADVYAKKINDVYKANSAQLGEKFVDLTLNDYHLLSAIINHSAHTEGSILSALSRTMIEALKIREAEEVDELKRQAEALLTKEDVQAGIAKVTKEAASPSSDVTPEVERSYRNLTDMTQYYLDHLEERLKSLGKRRETMSKVVGGFGGGGVVRIPGNAVQYDALVENIKVLKELQACFSDKYGKNKAEQIVDFAVKLHKVDNNKFPDFLKANWKGFSDRSAGYIDAALGTRAKKLISATTEGMWKQAAVKPKVVPESKEIVYRRSHKKKY